MKKRILVLSFLSLILLSAFISAECKLTATMINQDPYPAVPGDYVKLLFQLDGVENRDCENIYFELISEYPLSFDPGINSITNVKAGTFTKDYSSFLMLPYKVRVDSDALDGDTPIEVRFASSPYTTSFPQNFYTEKFDLNIQDVKTDFEIFVKDYIPATKTLTFEILNTGESDVEALTLEIAPQSNVEVKGASRNIVGSLDSNDFTTADFEAIPKTGNIDLIVYYTDETNTRRTIEKAVSFDSRSFEGRENGEGRGFSFYLVIILIIAGVAYYFYRKHKHSKRKKLLK